MMTMMTMMTMMMMMMVMMMMMDGDGDGNGDGDDDDDDTWRVTTYRRQHVVVMVILMWCMTFANASCVGVELRPPRARVQDGCSA